MQSKVRKGPKARTALKKLINCFLEKGDDWTLRVG